MAGVFREAGLRDVTETEVAIPSAFDHADQYFTFMNEIAAPVVAGMALADEQTRAKIKETVFGLVNGNGKLTNGKLRLDAVTVKLDGAERVAVTVATPAASSMGLPLRLRVTSGGRSSSVMV